MFHSSSPVQCLDSLQLLCDQKHVYNKLNSECLNTTSIRPAVHLQLQIAEESIRTNITMYNLLPVYNLFFLQIVSQLYLTSTTLNKDVDTETSVTLSSVAAVKRNPFFLRGIKKHLAEKVARIAAIPMIQAITVNGFDCAGQ